MHSFDWSTNPILLKIDILVRLTMMHVWNSWFLKKNYWQLQIHATYDFFANTFVCTVMTDLLAQFCWKLIYMYVIWWCMSKIIDFLKISIGSCKLMHIYANAISCFQKQNLTLFSMLQHHWTYQVIRLWT